MFLTEWPCGSVLALSHKLSAGLLLQQLCGTWWSQLIFFSALQIRDFCHCLAQQSSAESICCLCYFSQGFLDVIQGLGRGAEANHVLHLASMG